MADALLALFVEYTETGRWSNVHVTVALSGGIVAGELISARQFLEDWEEQTTFHRMNEATGEIDEAFSLSESGPSRATPPVVPSEYLHLREPVILNATPQHGRLPQIGTLRIRLDAVTAWSPGRVQWEEQK